MNANELADKLQELDSKLHLIDLFKAATMLRQQQLEITGLKLEWQVWSDMNLALRDRVAFLESQVYGGTTK